MIHCNHVGSLPIFIDATYKRENEGMMKNNMNIRYRPIKALMLSQYG